MNNESVSETFPYPPQFILNGTFEFLIQPIYNMVWDFQQG